MKIIIQRVSRAAVIVRGKTIGQINHGLMALVGIKKGDTEAEAEWLVDKMLSLRIFEDEEDKMNRSVEDIDGGLLLVPNFTLYADASQGNRPGFSAAESPKKAGNLYKYLVEHTIRKTGLRVENGKFGAYMNVELVNDGPVTITLEK